MGTGKESGGGTTPPEYEDYSEKEIGGETKNGKQEKARKKERKIAVFDFETDPFKRGLIVKPFAWGFYDGDRYEEYWGDDAAETFWIFLQTLKDSHLIYAHNGGKFDFLFLLRYFSKQHCKIINGRIVSIHALTHELRDSYAILPVPLKQSGNKKEIDYDKMERGRRWRHKKEILAYLYQDCVALYDMVIQFRANLGTGLTMAGTATRLLRAITPEKVEQLTLEQDKDFRQFFFGGRVECFEKGIVKDNLKLLDVRSMYPSVMKSNLHPIGNRYVESTDFDDNSDYVQLDCFSNGAFPLRDKNGLAFPKTRGVFFVTGHELRAAMELRLVNITRIIRAITFTRRGNFQQFVDEYTRLRKQATDAGDEIGKLHYKLVQNSSYGRFALNPEKLYTWMIQHVGAASPGDEWEPYSGGNDVIFWRKKVSDYEKMRAISNVATGASITGAARARLLYAIHSADRKIYCDTDSIIARSIDVPEDDGQLGSWQLEALGNKIAVAGKKLYAMFGEQPVNENEKKKRIKLYGDETCIKLASKGVRLTAQEIVRVCCGDTVTWRAETPSMGLDGSQTYMERRVVMR